MVGVMDVPVRDTAAYRNYPLAMVAYATQANNIHQNISRRESNTRHIGAFQAEGPLISLFAHVCAQDQFSITRLRASVIPGAPTNR